MDPSPHRSRAAALVDQLSSYASYHRDPRNQRTHFIGVPLISFSLLTVLSLPSLPLLETHVALERIVLVALAVFYLYLDVPLGLALTLVLAALAVAAEAVGQLGAGRAGLIAAVSFIAGWCAQLLGHHLEGNRPALLDNLRQIFIAPIYLMAELAFALGLRCSLQAQIHQRIAHPAALPRA